MATSTNTPIEQTDGVQTAHLDLTKRHSIDGFLNAALRTFSPIDHVVLLSGVLPGRNMEEYDWDAMNQVVQVNFTGQLYLVGRLLKYMRVGGSILCVSSIAAERGSYDAAYAGSKAAIVAMAKSVATWQGARLRANCVAPGLIEGSRMFDEMLPERREIHRDRVPNKELLNAADLALVIKDLTEKHWSHLNGAVIRLNGGSYV